MGGTLVITSRPPGGEGWDDLLNLAGEDLDWGILFYGDGVYGLRSGSPRAQSLAAWRGGLLAVDADLEARGGKDDFPPRVRAVTYGQIVELLLAAGRVVSWA